MVDTLLLFQRGDAAEEMGDFGLARSCFEQGVELGDIAAMTRLAYLFDVGLGVNRDKARAMQLYRRAWRSSCTVAANNIVLYRERENRRAMFQWFIRSAEAGDVGARIELAKCYRDGVGVRRSLQLALRSFAAALTDEYYLSEAEVEEAHDMIASLRPRLVQS